MAEYSEKMAEIVKGVLDEREWRHGFDAERGIFRFSMGVKSKIKKVDMVVFVGLGDLVAFGHLPLGADEGVLGRVGEYITRANYGLTLGNFEMDLRDGEVRYRASLCFGEILPSPDAVLRTLTIPLAMWQKYGDGLLAVMFSDASPAEEIQKAEAPE